MKNLNGIPKIWNIQYDTTKFFGREAFIDNLHHILEAPDPENTKQVAVVGLPGTGKTQTVKQYARTFKKNYDIVWWFYPAENIDNQFLNLAKEINAKLLNPKTPLLISSGNPKETIAQMEDFLRSTNHHWLLIFDDVPNIKEIEKYIPEHHSLARGHILITSKNPKDWNHSLQLDKFPRSTSVEIIQYITNDNDKTAAFQLAEVLDDYPILIAHAAETIKNLFSDTHHFLKTMDSSNGMTNITDLASNTFKYTLDNIQKNAPSSYELLLFSAVLFNENIPRELLEKWFIENKYGNAYDFEVSLSVLSKHFLLSKSNTLVDASIDNYELYNMHEIIKKVLLKRIPKKELKHKIKEAIMALNVVLDKKGKKVVLPEFSYLYPQISNIFKLSQAEKIKDKLLLQMEIEVLDYYQIVERNFTKMAEHAKLLSSLFDLSGNCQDEICARFNTALSGLKWWTGDHRAGIPYQLKSLKFYEKYKPGVHEHIRALNYLASQYSFLGDIENAQKITKKIGDLLKNISDNDSLFYHYNSAIFYQNCTLILSLQGKHQEAIAELNKALDAINEIEKQFNNPEKRLPLYLHFLIHQQELLLYSGEGKDQLNKLLNLYQDAIRVLNSKRHRLCGILLALIGNSLNLQGKTVEAESYLMESLSIFDDCFREKSHKLQAEAYTILGDIYLNAKEPIKALHYYLLAESTYKNAYVYLKVDPLSVLYEKIVLVSVALKDDLTARRYFNLHKSVFGREHFRTSAIFAHLTQEVE